MTGVETTIEVVSLPVHGEAVEDVGEVAHGPHVQRDQEAVVTGDAVALGGLVQFGLRRSLPLLLGIAAGLTTLAVAASLGLAGVLLGVHLELVVRVLGSLYLLWLAWTIAGAGAPGRTSLTEPRRFRTGVLLLWLNPKAWAITLSAAGAFASRSTGRSRSPCCSVARSRLRDVLQVLWCRWAEPSPGC